MSQLNSMFLEQMDALAKKLTTQTGHKCTREMLDSEIENDGDLIWLRSHVFLEQSVIPALKKRGMEITGE